MNFKDCVLEKIYVVLVSILDSLDFKLVSIFDVLVFKLESLNFLRKNLDSLVTFYLILNLEELLGDLFVFLFRILMGAVISRAKEPGSCLEDLVPKLFSHTDHEGDHDQFEGRVDSSEGGDQVVGVFVLDSGVLVGRIVIHQS